MKIQNSENVKDTSLILILIVANLFAYWKVTQLGFNIIDDADYISNNEYIKKGLSIDVLIWALKPNADVANWHPLTWFSHIADYLVWGLKAQWHHVTNLIIHIINSLLLYCLLRRITKNIWICFVVIILFSLHPLRIESVAWISERKDLLSSFFLVIVDYCIHELYKTGRMDLLFIFIDHVCMRVDVETDGCIASICFDVA